MTDDDRLTGLGSMIRRIRESRGMTLEDLAHRAELTTNFIVSIENGERDVALTTVFALANGLGVTMGELMGAKPEHSAAAMRAAQLMEQVPPKLQEEILELLRAAVET
jgi:transcriptional regulator with XRE-family HTH domain